MLLTYAGLLHKLKMFNKGGAEMVNTVSRVFPAVMFPHLVRRRSDARGFG
jgi:hypothetical protein